MWHIYYRDIINEDPIWHLYDDFVGAEEFNSASEAEEFLNLNKDEFEGCVTRIAKDSASA